MILHFGDYGPSGIDMSRDIVDRLGTFGAHLRMDRLALNIDQVRKYNPPPNPAKVTDSRFASYAEEFGAESWELDALEPSALIKLAEDAVLKVLDGVGWEATLRTERTDRSLLKKVALRWEEVVEFLEDE